MANIGERIRQLRLERGWTQETLANLLGVSRLAVARWETGERRPRKKYLDKLAEVFGLPMEELLGVELKGKDKALTLTKASEVSLDPLALQLVQELMHSKGLPFRETPTAKKLLLIAEKRVAALRAELEVLFDIMQQLPEDTVELPSKDQD